MLQEPLVGARDRESDPVTLDGTAARLLDAGVACISPSASARPRSTTSPREPAVPERPLYRYFPGKPASSTLGS